MKRPKKDKKKLLKVKKIKISQRKRVTFYRKKKINRKKLYNEQCLLFTPHNTNEFLIKNQSTPFIEEEEENFSLEPFGFINLNDEIQNLFSNQMESTKEDTYDINNNNFINSKEKTNS